MELKEEHSAMADYYKSDKEGYLVRCQAKRKRYPPHRYDIDRAHKRSSRSAMCGMEKQKQTGI